MPGPLEPVSGKRECKADIILARTEDGCDLGWYRRFEAAAGRAIRPAGETLTVDNDEAGIKALSKELRKWSPQLIVLEATGGHEYASAYSLTKAGLPVAVVNPR